MPLFSCCCFLLKHNSGNIVHHQKLLILDGFNIFRFDKKLNTKNKEYEMAGTKWQQ